MPAMRCALVERLQTIPDPRRQGENLRHPLVDLLILGFCGVVAGCEGFVEVVKWGKVHEAFLRTFLALPHGMASHDTFPRVFAMRQPAGWQEVVLSWLLERWGVSGDYVPLEGKALRGTRCQRRKLKALPVVSAWAGQSGITLGQVVAAKSTEITAMPELLQLLDLHEKIVTTDARGGQKAIAEAIVEGGGTLSWRSTTLSPPCMRNSKPPLCRPPPRS